MLLLCRKPFILLAILLCLFPKGASADTFSYYINGRLTHMPAADWGQLFVTTQAAPTLDEAKRLQGLVPAAMRSTAQPMLYAPSGGFVMQLRNVGGLSETSYRAQLAALVQDPAVVSVLPAFREPGMPSDALLFISGKVLLRVSTSSVRNWVELLPRLNADLAEALPTGGAETVLVAAAKPGADVFALARRLYEAGPSRFAEPNLVFQGRHAVVPNDPSFAAQSFP